MLELARLGAGVLHSRSVEFAKKYNIRLHVRSSFNYDEGTIVMPREEMMEKFVISGVTAKTDEAKITIRDIPDRPGIAATAVRPAGGEQDLRQHDRAVNRQGQDRLHILYGPEKRSEEGDEALRGPQEGARRQLR